MNEDDTLEMVAVRDSEKSPEEGVGLDFIRRIVSEDRQSSSKKNIALRFPPEPNGYLHIGHAKSICLNFGLAQEMDGRCHLRFDDTNPVKEEIEYIDSIEEDVKWLGFDWGDHRYFASDHFDQLYEWAEHLVIKDKAYVDDLSAEKIREFRGTLTKPGENSPYRDRSAAENLGLLKRMKLGEFLEGSKVLRAKIDMASGNMNLRDPVLYRIIQAPHPRTGDAWCIYPTYDFAHGQSDSIEHVTHSLCTLEFQDHRPLYDWLLEHLPVHNVPRQIEFARLNLTYTVLSKRYLAQLVEMEQVSGWDDPRMPTLSGLRRRGIPPAAIRDFCVRVGINKSNSVVEMEMFDACVREHLNKNALRRMAVLRPLKVVIENFPEGKKDDLQAVNNPENKKAGVRDISFSREIYIERDDFMENPPKKYYRLSPGREVRLRYAYFVTCTEVIKNDAGEVEELRCIYDPETRGGNAPDGRKVRATLHWVSSKYSLEAEVRFYDRLFLSEEPGKEADVQEQVNPQSLEVLQHCKLEPALIETPVGETVQFERLGYFCVDKESTKSTPIFNRTMTLRDNWAKIMKKG